MFLSPYEGKVPHLHYFAVYPVFAICIYLKNVSF
jgi:hypothetical protein